jgi:hypothetical protein
MMLLHRRNDAESARARLSDLVTAHHTGWLGQQDSNLCGIKIEVIHNNHGAY